MPDGSRRTDGTVSAFAQDLARLRDMSGLSFRQLEKPTNYSRTALAKAVKGEAMPSLEVTLALVRACQGDVPAWEEKWRRAQQALVERRWESAHSMSPFPLTDVVDHADPDDARLSGDATTVQATKITVAGERWMIGQVELRYSAHAHAAWGRFQGYKSLDHLTLKGTEVTVEVGVVREEVNPDQDSYRHSYIGDYHWSSLLTTGRGRFHGYASLWSSGTLLASGRTDDFPLA